MASRKDNLKSLFSNSRTRIIILFTAALFITAVVIGVLKIRSSGAPGPSASAEITSAPQGIQSIPGALDPTAQYAELIEKQNLTQAEQAAKTGGSAIPTIIRTQKIGEGAQVIGATGGAVGVGFKALSLAEQGGPQKSLWIEALKNSNCSTDSMNQAITEGAGLSVLKEACSCVQLKENGYALDDLQKVCSCKELRASGYNARQLKDVGFSAARLRTCGFNACELKNAGFTAQEMKDGQFTDGELKGAGYSANAIEQASGLPDGITADDVRKAGCSVEALTRLREAGVTAAAIRRISGCSAEQLKAAGFSADDLAKAGFTAAELKKAGFSPENLRKAGYSARDLMNAGFTPDELKKAGYTEQQLSAAGPTPANILAAAGFKDCSVETLRKARAAGVTARTIRDTLGCSAAAMKAAGYTAKELKDAGFTAAELKNAGFSADDLKKAGFSAKELKDAGFTADDLKNAGFSRDQLKDAGFSDEQLKEAGFTPPVSAVAQLPAPAQPAVQPSQVMPAPTPPAPKPVSQIDRQQEQLQNILQRQTDQMAEQQYQQNINQRSSEMLSAANQNLQSWKKVSEQAYMAGKPPKETKSEGIIEAQTAGVIGNAGQKPMPSGQSSQEQQAVIKAGDILFAVLDTSVNSDEPGPILASIVSGPLKGSKLIGSFNLPANSDKMVIQFNTLSVPGASRTISISAFAIDPNTARTALSSRTDHHYLMRYGSLFASTFLEGFGNAFQSANTTVTIGGTGGGNDIQVQNGVGRSALENAVIALATVGKTWSQQAQQLFNTPTTVEVFSGTGLGILFTQDLTSL